ncbi:MAG: hypothetical protein ACXADY_17315 [Candidatus Hodarchaeales archaeon]|jgi:hypothetical protein
MKKFADDRYLRIAFLIGGIYDLILGISLLFFSDFLIELLNITKPDNMIFTKINGLFLITVGYFLIYARQNVRKLAFIGFGSAFIRFSYACIVLITWITQEIELVYLIVGITDGLTAIILLIPLLMTDDVTWKQIWQF